MHVCLMWVLFNLDASTRSKLRTSFCDDWKRGFRPVKKQPHSMLFPPLCFNELDFSPNLIKSETINWLIVLKMSTKPEYVARTRWDIEKSKTPFFLNSKLYFAKIKLWYCAHFNEHFLYIIGMHFQGVQEINLKGQEKGFV